MSDTPAPRQNVARGITFKVISVLLILAMSALVKTMGDVPIGEILFFRATFAIPPIIAMLILRGQLRQGLKTRNPWGHVLRSLIGVSGMCFMFLALLNLPLPDTTAIYYAMPLVITVLSVIFYKENVRLFRWSAVLIGFAGVLIVIWPNLSFNSGGTNFEGTRQFGIVMALCGVMTGSFAAVLVRKLVKTETSEAIVLYYSVMASILCLATFPFGWVLVSAGQMAILVMIGILGGLGQIFLTDSFRHADMSVIAPFEYSSLIFSSLIGYFFFAEIPTLYTIAGGLIVTAAGVAIIWRERHLGLKRELKEVASR